MHVRDTATLTLDGARAVLAAAVASVVADGSAASVAVVDPGGHLLALERMDGAAFHTVHSATTKATCAVSMRKPTGPLPFPDPSGSYAAGITSAAGAQRWTALPGGVPVFAGEVCGGAIGVAGAPPEVDGRAAAAGAAAVS